MMRTIHTPLFAPFRGALIIIGVQRYNFFLNLQALAKLFSSLNAYFCVLEDFITFLTKRIICQIAGRSKTLAKRI